MPALSTTSRRSTKHPHVLARAAGNLKLPIVERVDRSFDVVRALKVYLRAPPSIAIDERARVRHPSRASKRVLHVSPIRASRQILHLHRMLRLSRRRALPHRRSRVRAIAPSRSIVRPLSIASHPSRVSIAPVAVVPVAAVPVAARLPLPLPLPPAVPSSPRQLRAHASPIERRPVLRPRRARGVARVVERHERERRRMSRSLDLDARHDAVRREPSVDVARRRVERQVPDVHRAPARVGVARHRSTTARLDVTRRRALRRRTRARERETGRCGRGRARARPSARRPRRDARARRDGGRRRAATANER